MGEALFPPPPSAHCYKEVNLVSKKQPVLVVIAQPQAGKESELKSRLEGVARASWEEAGVVTYAVHDLVDSLGGLMLVEVYENQAAFDSHLETRHVKEFLADVGSLVDGELVIYEATAAPFSEGPKGLVG